MAKVRHAVNGPYLEREAATAGPPQLGGKQQAIDAVAENGSAGVFRMRRFLNVFQDAGT